MLRTQLLQLGSVDTPSKVDVEMGKATLAAGLPAHSVMDVAKSISSGSLDELTALTKSHPVLVFSKSNCPFAFELKRTLASLGVPYAKVEVNQHSAANKIRASLLSLSGGVKTLPVLFVDGACIGGCDDLKAMEHDGDLAFLAPHATAAPVLETQRVRGTSPLLWFPHTIDYTTARLTSGFVVAICVLCIAFFNEAATPWVVLALAVDFTIRMCFGGATSFLGALAGACLACRSRTPVFKAGAPKQFAAFCGVFFSVFAAGLYLGNQRVGGAVVLGCLMGAAALEFVLDFCLGCWMFGIGISAGVLSPSIYRASLNLKLDRRFAWRWANADATTYPHVHNEHVLLPGQSVPSEVDLIRKPRLEAEAKNADWSPIRHTRIDHFGIPLALAALALAYRMLGTAGQTLPARLNWVDSLTRTGDALAITSASVFCALGLLYFIKMAMYTKKVVKEWSHPTTGNLFSAISICLCIYGIFMYAHDSYFGFGITLVWMGSVMQMALAVLVVARLAFDHHSMEVINPSIMMAPVGNFVCAIALASYPFNANSAVNYVYIARLWFAIAGFFAVVMFTVTFQASMTSAHADARVRPLLFIWQATASVAGPALFAVSGTPVGLMYQSLWMIAMFFFFVNCVGWLKGFYSFVPDNSIWVMAFSCAATAISTIHYFTVSTNGDEFVEVLVYFALATATASLAVCGAHTLSWIVDGSAFKPRQKWGPLSFMKLTHEALRMAIPRLSSAVAKLDDASGPRALASFAGEVEALMRVAHVHGDGEDNVLFPAVRAVFPGFEPSVDAEHAAQHAVMGEIEAAAAVLRASDSSSSAVVHSALTTLATKFPAWGTHMLDHMRHEENSITVVARKYFALDRAVELTRAVYNGTSPSDWAVVLPWVITHLPHPGWKARFVRSFAWAMPDRAQELGLILYRGCDSAVYASLVDEIPEIAPRGTPGWRREY